MYFLMVSDFGPKLIQEMKYLLIRQLNQSRATHHNNIPLIQILPVMHKAFPYQSLDTVSINSTRKVLFRYRHTQTGTGQTALDTQDYQAAFCVSLAITEDLPEVLFF